MTISNTLRARRVRLAAALTSSLLFVSGAYALVGGPDAAWQPLVTLFGRGETTAAVSELSRITSAVDALLHRRRIDETTRELIDGTRADLEGFNLGKVQARIAESSAGASELRIRGDLRGDEYIIQRAGTDADFRVGLNAGRDELAAAALTVRSKRLWSVNQRTAFAFGGSFALGIGDVRWDLATRALERAARIVASVRLTADAPTLASSEAARASAHAAHPALQNEDLDVVALAYDGFPALTAFLSKFGTIEDVRTVASERSYQQVNILLRGLPKRFKQDYPLLATYVGDLRDLVRLRGRWVDARGRTLASVAVDTEALTARVSCYVKDGRLVPSQKGMVFEDDPVDPLAPELARSKFISTAHLKMFSMTITLSDLEVDLTYRPHASWAEFGGSFTKVPSVDVSGKALGFIPRGLVDAFVPGGIAGLTRDFLRTAANAHDGQGAAAKGALGILRSASQRAVVEVEGDAVVLDNGLVQMAVAMVNERLLPSDALTAEMEKAVSSGYTAWSSDFARFQRSVATASR